MKRTRKATGSRRSCVHHTAKTSAQLNADIDEALAERARDEENAKFNEEVSRMKPREQEIVLKVQEIGALGDILKSGGLNITHGRDGFIHVTGKTFVVKDVLKKHGFRWNGTDWTRQYAPQKKVGKIDYLSMYGDLIKKLQ